MTSNKSPDFIGIGAMKSASTWILRCLSEHPEICSFSGKDIHFFNDDCLYEKGIKFYELFFLKCGDDKIKGEYSPKYMYDDRSARRIFKHYPNVKIVACIRNPVDRAISNYKYSLAKKGRLSFYKNFDEAVKKDYELVQRGMYYEQLKSFYSLFPRKNILVVLYDDILEDSFNFMQTIYKFLGVNSDYVPENLESKVNKTGQKILKTRLPFVNEMLYSIRNKFGLNTIFYRKKIFWLGKKIVNLNKKYTEESEEEVLIPDDVKKYLKDVYKSDIQKLEELIQIDLGLWKK